MPVTLTGGVLRKRGGGLWSEETLTQATATTFQALSLTTDETHVGMGTATSFNRNRYSLAAGTAGQRKLVLATATGEANVFLTGGTATGLWVLGEANDFLDALYFGGGWHIMASSGATLATAT